MWLFALIVVHLWLVLYRLGVSLLDFVLGWLFEDDNITEDEDRETDRVQGAGDQRGRYAAGNARN